MASDEEDEEASPGTRYLINRECTEKHLQGTGFSQSFHIL